MKLLSIILPVYKVENYIWECVDSIFKQGLSDPDFEVIFVNDGTPDNSIEIIEDFVSFHDNITIINQENMGVSKARNAGLAASQGLYVYFMDPDDLLVNNALSVLLAKVLSSSADILMAGYCRFDDGEDFSKLLYLNQTYLEKRKSGEQAFLEDLSPYECYIWLMIIKRDFLISNNIDFKPFWYEDTLFCQECFLKARAVIKTDFRLYVYRLRSGSFTSSMNLNKMLDLNSCLAALTELKETVTMSDSVRKKLTDNIFSSLNYGLYCITHNESLYKVRRKIVSDLKHKIPASQLVFANSSKQMFVSIALRYVPYAYLWLRHFLK